MEEILPRWHIRVRARVARLDGHGRDVLADIHRLELRHIREVRSSRVYFLEGALASRDTRRIAEELLADPVAETCEWGREFSPRKDDNPAIEVHVQPGVMNPAAATSLGAIRRLLRHHGGPGARIDDVQIARRYEVVGARGLADLEQIASKILANGCIENAYIQGCGRNDALPGRFATPPERAFTLTRVPIRVLDDDALRKLSRESHLFLSLDELRTLRDHYVRLNRDPTDLELETFAQTWSEHCVHKTLKSAMDYRGAPFSLSLSADGAAQPVEVHYDNLLRETIVAATRTLGRDWCLSVFEDNAGVMAFDEEYGIAFKVETHNHPSALEPYGGASTGVGGCIRDILGCGLGAKPIASTDVFCLAPPDFDGKRLPKDVLHPRRVLKGVVSGVRDYGNRMGIPTVNGAILFDERYLANPLVFCGCVGLIPRDRIRKQVNPGDRIVLAGGRTGRDGIHGATFSSAELTDTHADEFAHAVQIGNAIEEKKLLDALLLARDHPTGCLFSAVTDCGAGGLSSAVGEMAAKLGAEVQLDKVPLKYTGLRYDEIWISEAQERMVFAVPPNCLKVFLKVFADEEVETAVIGTFTGDGVLRVSFRGESVGELDVRFLHEGIPKTIRFASWPSGMRAGHSLESSAELTNEQLLHYLRNLNVASKEWVVRQYDHEVQGRSVVKPLVGPGFGPSDAAVLRPRLDRYRGIALGCGICPHRTEADPYLMAVFAVDEALRNIICVGADPERTAILDNFCWPKVETPESLGALVRACQGAADAAVAYGLPFISGKDSLNNEFSMSEEESRRTGLPSRLAIPGTLLISSLGIVEDVRRCITMDLKEPGNVLVLASAPVDQVGWAKALDLHRQVAQLIQDGKVRAAHDVSDGGLAVAVVEMCIAGQAGASVSIIPPFPAHRWFADVATTYVLEMEEGDARACGLPILGRVESEPGQPACRRFRVNHERQRQTGLPALIDLPLEALTAAWREPLAVLAGG